MATRTVKVYFCDRCGAQYNPYHGYIDTISGLVWAVVRRGESDFLPKTGKDMCNDCTTSFLNWFERGKRSINDL